jgi:hypothetical protein
MDTSTIIDYIFKAAIAAGFIAFLATFSEFRGKVERFLSNEWPHFVERIDRIEGKIDTLEGKFDGMNKR